MSTINRPHYPSYSSNRPHAVATTTHTASKAKKNCVNILHLSSETLVTIMTQYLTVWDTISLSMSAKHFQNTIQARPLWQFLFKKHNPDWRTSHLHLVVQNQIQGQTSQELAYKKLCLLCIQRKEISWSMKTSIRTVGIVSMSDPETDPVVLSNGNIAVGSSADTAFIWSSSGARIPTTDLATYKLGVRFIRALPKGCMVTTAAKSYLAHLWSPDGSLLKTLKGHTEDITCLATFSDGRILTGCRGKVEISGVWAR